MTERQAIDWLIETKGELVAATAHEGFCAGGRGCVVTDGPNAAYMPLAIVRRLPPPIGRRGSALVKRYDPGREFVEVTTMATDLERCIEKLEQAAPRPPCPTCGGGSGPQKIVVVDCRDGATPERPGPCSHCGCAPTVIRLQWAEDWPKNALL